MERNNVPDDNALMMAGQLAIFRVALVNSKNKSSKYRTGASIPVPLECKSSALPFELVPLVQ